jgi:hypothetical protein
VNLKDWSGITDNGTEAREIVYNNISSKNTQFCRGIFSKIENNNMAIAGRNISSFRFDGYS